MHEIKRFGIGVNQLVQVIRVKNKIVQSGAITIVINTGAQQF